MNEVPEFALQVTENGHGPVVRLAGELDLASADQLPRVPTPPDRSNGHDRLHGRDVHGLDRPRRTRLRAQTFGDRGRRTHLAWGPTRTDASVRDRRPCRLHELRRRRGRALGRTRSVTDRSPAALPRRGACRTCFPILPGVNSERAPRTVLAWSRQETSGAELPGEWPSAGKGAPHPCRKREESDEQKRAPPAQSKEEQQRRTTSPRESGATAKNRRARTASPFRRARTLPRELRSSAALRRYRSNTAVRLRRSRADQPARMLHLLNG